MANTIISIFIFLPPLLSHASHASHASHRSGSGGGYSYPTPDYTAPTTPTRPSQAAPTSPNTSAPTLTRSEKLKLQVMRVQIALTSLGLYNGSINGELDDKTKESIRYFQTVKGLDRSGLMTTETLNALGVPAVQ